MTGAAPSPTPTPSACGPREPHFSADWFALLTATALPPGTRTERIEVTASAGEGLDGGGASILALMRLAHTPWQLEALATFYSPLYGPVDHALPAPDALAHALRAVRTATHERTAVIDLSPLDPADPFFTSAQHALRQAGWLTDRYFRFGNWYTPVATTSFAEYLAARPSRLRNTLERSRRKLERLGNISTLILTRPDPALEQAIADFVAVYNSSWKRPEPYPEFVPGLCRLAAARGWLRLGLIRSGSIAVAAQLWLVAGGRAQIVKLAHAPDWQHGSIGTVLTAALIEHVIEHDRVNEIDFLIGDDAYKRDWTPLRRERHGLIAFNPASARGLLKALRHFAGRAVQRLRPAAAAAAVTSAATSAATAATTSAASTAPTPGATPAVTPAVKP